MTDEEALDEVISALYCVQAERCVTEKEVNHINEVVDYVTKRFEANYPWVEITDDKSYPEEFNLVYVAIYDSKKNCFMFYTGWYNKSEKQWFLNDYGYTESVTHWMPIPEIKHIEIK